MTKLGVMITAVCVAAAFGSAAASAAITTYSDRTVFTAATGVTTIETFGPDAAFPIASGMLNSSTVGCCANGTIAPGLILPGVTYSTPVGTGFFFNIDAGAGYEGGFLDGLSNNQSNGILTISFDSAQSAFGFDTNSFMPNFDLAIYDATGQIYSSNFSTSGFTFYGFESSAANIVKVTINNTSRAGFDFALDNFTFNGSGGGAVPEPSGWAMLLTGFGVMGVAMRRRRATAPA